MNLRTVDEQDKLHLWLHYGTESSVRQFQRVCARYADLGEAWRLAAARRSSAFEGLPEHTIQRLFQAADEGFMTNYVEWLIKRGVDVYMPMHADYPALLKEIRDPPEVLFVRGRLMKDMPLSIALVGSREPTDYGKSVARSFGQEFSQAGAVVVSGLARGVDAFAARGALDCRESDYPTIAVLGSGIDVIYPPDNRDLYAEIAERGAVATEFLPGAAPKREHFPIRNRIISGLSRGVVIVEAGERSGTSITASLAHDQGREVFAVPGRITDPMSVGTNRSIGAGEAKPVTSGRDVLAEFDYLDAYNALYTGAQRISAEALSAGAQRIPAEALSEQELAVYRLLQGGEKTIDELCELLPYSVGEINSALTAMLFSGIMKQLPGRLYMLDTACIVVCGD